VLEFAKAHPEVSTIVLIQATSPLLKDSDLEVALNSIDEQGYDSLLSVVRQKRFIWEKSPDGAAVPLNYDPGSRPRRQEFDGFLVENGAFYITQRDALLSSLCRLNGRVGVYEMSEESYFEIDEPADWQMIENILKRDATRIAATPGKNKIRMFVTDVDGVLTDAGMYYSETGDEMKKFNTRDGLGMRLLQEAGIIVGIITSENTRIVTKRAEKLKVDFVYQGVFNKLEILLKECRKYKIDPMHVAYIGDDANDIDCLKAVGFSYAPADAIIEVKEIVRHLLSRKGGEGAVREAVENILCS
jgi:N-acylneuraminate cytidylyltransferase